MAGHHKQPYGHGGKAQEKGSNRNAASACTIGAPFHNPYTFIPFPETVKRFLPTPMTADEHPDEKKRKSGILELEVQTLSPLMTCNPKPVSEKNGHKSYQALTIGNDVIVPATGIRGAMRTLMTIISGGTLGYMDENLWLTQGRDAQLGPNKKNFDVPDNAFLAEVVKPGSEKASGVVRLGETRLIKADELKGHISNLDGKRPTPKEQQEPLPYRDASKRTWKVKLSGRPINRRGKREGLLDANGPTLELGAHFWANYLGRHRHAMQKELKKGDLIWLEPMEKDCQGITCEADVKSIQWARWGRRGVALKRILPRAVLPDSLRPDGGVDMVTDMFGQIPQVQGAAGPFAARVRPGNLIFFDAKGQTVTQTLAPLAPPHPGCIAFYRDMEDLDAIDQNAPLKGYKVYRNTRERGDNAPWKYTVQGVYKEKGALKYPETQKVNKTAELLQEGVTGKLRISFRALGEDELALLYAACAVDWKLGGGKPLGLGHCRVINIKMVDEEGNPSAPMEVPGNGENLELLPKYFKYIAHLEQRIKLYKASQVPVDRLRYPRAVTKNENKSSRAGLSWFARHASPRKTGAGLETLWTKGELRKKVQATQIKAQALPRLDPDDPAADLLYGYDMVELDVQKSGRNQRLVGKMEIFKKDIHTEPDEKAGENISQNRETRKAARADRSSD